MIISNQLFLIIANLSSKIFFYSLKYLYGGRFMTSKNSKSLTWRQVFSVSCFFALFFYGLATILSAVGISWPILEKIAGILVVVCLIITAYDALKVLRHKAWMIIFWVCVALALVGGIWNLF